MKHIYISVPLLFIFAASIFAQPQQYFGFDPFRICEYQSSDKIIFVGRVISFERVSSQLYNKEITSKITISVEKVFSGKLKKQVEIFWNESGSFVDLQKNDQRIFTARQSNLINSEILVSRGWSRKINDLSSTEKHVLFFDVKFTANRYPKSPVLFGTVIEKDKSSREASIEINDKFGYDTRNFKSIAGIVIEAKREEDGAIFHTKTDRKGVFIFDNLVDGNYFVYPLPPKVYEKSPDLFREYTFQNPDYRRLTYKIGKDKCNYGIVFEMRKAENL
jgi:hypothetical protein